jgi:hypothetical protein
MGILPAAIRHRQAAAKMFFVTNSAASAAGLADN